MLRFTQYPTRQQSVILALVAQGYSNAGIARHLDRSMRTVEVHLTHMYELLNIQEHENPRVILALEGLDLPPLA